MSDNLAAALAKLQTRLPEVKKSETAEVEMKNGGKFRYTYAGLSSITEQIMPALGELGLSFSARPTLSTEGKFVLAYELLHISGESRTGQYPLSGTTPQQQGSAITYARRYSLLAVTGLAPDEDDDAAAAEAEAQSRRGSAQRASRPAPPDRPQAQRAQRSTAPPLPGEEGRPEPMTPAQRAKLMAVFGQIGVKDREERLRWSSLIVRRELGSANDLTKEETIGLIDALENAAASPNPEEFLDSLVADPGGDPA